MRRTSSPIFAQAAALWEQMHKEFDLALQAHIDAADAACRGVLLNAAGRAACVSETRLFAANHATASRYASAELLEFWRAHPRPTLASFERAWFQDQFTGPVSLAA